MLLDLIDINPIQPKTPIKNHIKSKHYTSMCSCCAHDLRNFFQVFHRRINGEADFFLNWDFYERGFGNKTGEFWLGIIKSRSK